MDIDPLVAEALGPQGLIVYNDFAVYPVTRAAYISLAAVIGDKQSSAVLAMTQDDGNVSVVDLDAAESSSYAIKSQADDDISF